MAEVLFNNTFFVLIILYLQVEIFYFFCYNYSIFLSKTLKINRIYENSSNIDYSLTDYFIYSFTVLALVSIKGYNFSILYAIISIFILQLSKVLKKNLLNSLNFNSLILIILPLFSTSVILLIYVKSFLTLFMFIELYGVLYYFCFLTSHSFTKNSILKYKNGILLLLWNNFLTTFFLGLGSYFIIQSTGTSCFVELNNLLTNHLFIYLFLIGLSWKLGLPIFHFFKLEVYKFLLKENVFIFSIVTTLINIFILFFILMQPVILNALYINNFILILVLFSLNLVIVNLKISSLLHFFALSGVLTITTTLTLFLI